MSLGFWIQDFRVYRLLLVIAAIVAWIVWFTGKFYPAGYRQPLVPWTQFSLTDCAVVAVTLVASWKLQLKAWSRIRCGNTRTPLLFTMNEGEVYATFNRQGPVAGNVAAAPFDGLLTMEWRRGRPIALVGGIILAVFGIYMGSMMFIEGNPRRGIIGFIPAMMGFGGFLVGTMVTQDWIWTHKRPGLRPFIAALPFSDRNLSRAILWTLARGLIVIVPVSLSGLLVPVIAYSVLSGHFDLSAISVRVDAMSPAGIVTVVAASIALTWAIGGVVATLCVTGSPRTYVAAYAFMVGVPFTLITLDNFAGPTGVLIATGVQWLIGIAVLIATGLCFIIARQQELIANRAVAICCAVAATLAFAIGTTLADDWLLRFQGLCFAALVVVSFASLPLAVNWNRHR